MTGLSIDVLRAWERRYGAVVPSRAGRGRQYGTDQIQRLILLRDLVQNGHAIGTIAELDDVQLRTLLDAAAPPAPSLPTNDDLLSPVLRSLENLDQARAAEQLGRLAACLATRDLVFQVSVPLMREIGHRWSCGELSAAGEHLGSTVLRNLLGSLLRVHCAKFNDPRMLFATPENELHEFGILAAALLATTARWDSLYLGPNLPAHEIVRAAERMSARVVVLGVTACCPMRVEQVRRIAESLPNDTELWCGGHDEFEVPASVIRFPDLDSFELRCQRYTRYTWRSSIDLPAPLS